MYQPCVYGAGVFCDFHIIIDLYFIRELLYASPKHHFFFFPLFLSSQSLSLLVYDIL